MPNKPITKKYLMDRCSFAKQTVIKAVQHEGLWAIVKQLDPEDQMKIFKVVEHEVTPLNEDQIDSLFAYLPSEVREGLDFISMEKTEKLDIVRKNKATLKPIIVKKNFTDKLPLNVAKTEPVEEFSSSKLWNIIKSGKYALD